MRGVVGLIRGVSKTVSCSLSSGLETVTGL
jgi:hypothetical protein